MRKAALIGVDWGTSSLRAFLLDAAGSVLDRSESPNGIAYVEPGGFPAALSAAIGDWSSSGESPVLMSGMIGSRQGWIEAPYANVPTGAADLAAALVAVPFDHARVFIVPGVKTVGAASPDVVRGEETQVIGAMALLGADGGRFVLPGTHSKWVEAEEGRIRSFATYMTGDVYAAVRDHTILGRLMEKRGEDDREAFHLGVEDGAREGTPGALLHRLFAVRTAGLFGRLEAAALPDYLSGLLIGAEMADRKSDDGHPLHIIASHALAERYRAAAETLGIAACVVPGDCVVRGHMAIARLAGLI